MAMLNTYNSIILTLTADVLSAVINCIWMVCMW